MEDAGKPRKRSVCPEFRPEFRVPRLFPSSSPSPESAEFPVSPSFPGFTAIIVLMNEIAIERRGKKIASTLVPSEGLIGGDEQDMGLLRKMFEHAREYISSFSWCQGVLDSYFGGGVGGIFAVYFFHIQPSRSDVDPWIWIVVGDIPPAYLPLSDCESPPEVFETYIRGMGRWVEFARKAQARGEVPKDVPPIDLPATPEWAERINQRLRGLTLAVKPFFEKESGPLN